MRSWLVGLALTAVISGCAEKETAHDLSALSADLKAVNAKCGINVYFLDPIKLQDLRDRGAPASGSTVAYWGPEDITEVQIECVQLQVGPNGYKFVVSKNYSGR